MFEEVQRLFRFFIAFIHTVWCGDSVKDAVELAWDAQTLTDEEWDLKHP